MRHVIDTLGGIWELLLLALRYRLRLAGPYWRWRAETAFGTDPEQRPGWSARAGQIMAYGRWVYRMKRGR